MGPQTEADRAERLRRARALADELSAEARGEVYLSELADLHSRSTPENAATETGDPAGEDGRAARTAAIEKALRARQIESQAAQEESESPQMEPARGTASAKPERGKKKSIRKRFRLFRFLLKLICVLVVLYALFSVADRFTSLDLTGAAKEAIMNAKESVEVMLGLKAELTAGDFQSALLVEAKKQQQLVVYEKEISMQSELTKSLLDLDAFRLTKSVRSFATGYYAVDLAMLSDDNITYDAESGTVRLTVPAPTLYIVDFDVTKTQIEETERGLLAFGDIKLTQEEQTAFETSVKETLTKALSTDACFSEAADASTEALEKIFRPIVQAVDETAALEIYVSKA
ncbi:MAG: DUF4230 domain-containing protein [Oscillospiraceae bacterium]|nr:DUF4230 domain-containing protein [Oscillospiraceae bacterium]